MSQTDAEEFLSGFSGGLPSVLENKYEGLECLSNTEFGETFLLRRKEDDKLVVAKSYRKEILKDGHNEKDILAGLRHDSLPDYIETIESDGFVFVLREYMQGQPLDYWRKHNNPDDHQIMQIAIKICDALLYLHKQNPPIIHRDIKPSNIIVNGDNIYIIDFGISRLYDKDRRHDTTTMGTQGFASPEQYGFLQSDSKSDIYSFGVLLYYLLTGKTDLAAENVADKNIWRIIRKCTAFSPKERFRNTIALKNALVNYQKRFKQKVFAVTAAVAAACFILITGFIVGRYTDILRPPDKVTFVELLVEKAVRLALGKADGEPILRYELYNITELYFVGEEAAVTSDDYNRLCSDFNSGNKPEGTMTHLDDLKKMPNLRELTLFHQPLITNISLLAGLQQLTYLGLFHCNVSDISPLAELPKLENLTLFENQVGDYLLLEKIKSLKYLAVLGVPIKSVADLGDISFIGGLNFDTSQLESLDGVEKMVNMQDISLSKTPVQDFSLLDNLPELRQLHISPDMKVYLNTLHRDDVEVVIHTDDSDTIIEPGEYVFVEPLIEKAVRLALGKADGEPVLRSELEDITELYFIGDNVALSLEDYTQLKDARTAGVSTLPSEITRLDDIKNMPNLQELYICGAPLLTDVSPLAGHQKLIDLQLLDCNISDISTAVTIPNLKSLSIFGSKITDFSQFEKIKSLRTLDVGNMPLQNIAQLGDISYIEALYLHRTQIKNLDGIEKMVNLREIVLMQTLVSDFSPLDNLPNLKTLYISPDMEKYLNTLHRDDVDVIIQ